MSTERGALRSAAVRRLSACFERAPAGEEGGVADIWVEQVSQRCTIGMSRAMCVLVQMQHGPLFKSIDHKHCFEINIIKPRARLQQLMSSKCDDMRAIRNPVSDFARVP